MTALLLSIAIFNAVLAGQCYMEARQAVSREWFWVEVALLCVNLACFVGLVLLAILSV